MVSLAAEPERSSQPHLGEQLGVLGNELGENLIPALHGYYVREPDDPYLRMIASLLNALDSMDMEEFGVDCPFVQAKLEVLYTLPRLFSVSSFH
jgi:hypothetical protein